MTALLAADPAAVRQAAAALDATAGEAARLGRQLDRQRPPCWRSPSGRAYVAQLASLHGRVGAVARSHDEAAQVLGAYARALDEAQERARHAERLQREGARRSAAWTAQQLVGPDPGAALVAAAERTVREAEALERAAARQATLRLRELAAAAPEQGWTSKLLRPLEDVALTAVEGVRDAPAGMAALAGAAWSAVPWVHGARKQREGRAALIDAAKVWEAWLEAGRDAVNGRPGLAAGALLGAGLPRPRIKQSGFLKGVREGLLTVNDVGDAWHQAHAAKALQDRVVRLREVPLPGIEALLAGRVDLAHHEARGGHAILKHVDKRLATLQARLDLETKKRPHASRSTFPDLATAEELVRQALLAQRGKVEGLAASPGAVSTELRLALDAPVGTVLHKDGSVTSGRFVVVIVKKGKSELFIETAWLEP